MIIIEKLVLLIIRCSMTKKNTKIDIHFIKKMLDCGLICTPYVPTGHQLVNMLTKGL